MRSRDADYMCGLCDEFDVDQAAPELTAQGMGRCLVRDERGPLDLHVACGDGSCVSFRLDRDNQRRRRQFIDAHRRVHDTDQ
jgi:hypothetical protein